MYLLDSNYLTRPDTPEQREIYGYIRSLATLPAAEAVNAFYRLLWDGIAHPHETVQMALKEVVKAPDFDAHGLKMINRCYYTLANPWHLDGTRAEALENLILWLENIPAARGHSPFNRKLRDTLRLYQKSDYYTILKKHLHLLERANGVPNRRSPQQFGDLFSNYFFIYEAGTQTLDIEKAGGDLNAGILQKRDRELHQYHQKLNQFYIRYKRSSHADRVNPTHLSDEELCRAIDLYRPRRQNSFKTQTDLFKAEICQLGTTEAFKRAAYDHVMKPVYQLAPGHERWFSREFQTTLDSLPGDVPLTRVMKIQVFRRLLNALTRHDASRPGGDLLYYLLTGIGSDVVTSILLNIVLSCEMVRFELEKRFAHLHHRFADFKRETVQWLVDAFDHVNVALALNARHLGYFTLSALRDGRIVDSM